MIEQTTLLWIGTVALIATFGGLAISVPRFRNGEPSLIGVIAYGFALMFWGLFTLHSTGYIQTIGGGVTLKNSASSLTVVGMIGAILSVLLLFDAALNTLRALRG